MVLLNETLEVCAFCALVLQIGYADLSDNDRRIMSAHLMVHHNLAPFAIEP